MNNKAEVIKETLKNLERIAKYNDTPSYLLFEVVMEMHKLRIELLEINENRIETDNNKNAMYTPRNKPKPQPPNIW